MKKIFFIMIMTLLAMTVYARDHNSTFIQNWKPVMSYKYQASWTCDDFRDSMKFFDPYNVWFAYHVSCNYAPHSLIAENATLPIGRTMILSKPSWRK